MPPKDPEIGPKYTFIGGDCENVANDNYLHGCVWPSLVGTDY